MRLSILTAIILFVCIAAGVVRTAGQKEAAASDATDQWEYLVVAGPSNINLTPSGNSSARKEPSGGFVREGFVLEQQMDKLGAKGWELVSVSGSPSDPTYYFKRRK